MLDLRPTRCAICGDAPADEIYPARLVAADLNPQTFSARRTPDRVHYRMVRCSECGLVRSDPVADTALLNRLYQESEFSYGAEEPGLRRTYGRYLERIWEPGADRGALLEIGAGNGFLLEEALRRGYSSATGVEPSEAAISRASPEIRPLLIRDLFRPGLFEPASFSTVCLFQVFDHLPDPAGVLDEVRRVLRPGGRVLFFNHDIGSWSARLLGERSPIVDVEHTYLYSRDTLRRLLEARRFRVIRSGSGWNSYSLQYLAHLVPLPAGSGHALADGLRLTRLGRLPLTVPLGNLYLVAEPSE